MRDFANRFPANVDEYENLLTGNPIWGMRTKGVAKITAEDAIALGASGPTLRGSGVDFDLRRDMPYSGYENFKFKVPVAQEGDVFARYMCRVQELRESIGIVQQALDGMPEGPIKADAPKVVLPDREKDEDADGSAHLSLQDYYGRLCGAGGRGLSGGRVAARRDGLLHRERWNGQAVPGAHALGVPGQYADCCRRCAKESCWRMWWRRLGASISCWGKLTGKDW